MCQMTEDCDGEVQDAGSYETGGACVTAFYCESCGASDAL